MQRIISEGFPASIYYIDFFPRCQVLVHVVKTKWYNQRDSGNPTVNTI